MKVSFPLIAAIVALGGVVVILLAIRAPADTHADSPITAGVPQRMKATQLKSEQRQIAASATRLPPGARLQLQERARIERSDALAESGREVMSTLRHETAAFADAVQLDKAGRRSLERLIDDAQRELTRWVRVIELGGELRGTEADLFARLRTIVVEGAEAAFPEQLEALHRHVPQAAPTEP